MYSREARMRAIKLYTKYDKCAADAIREPVYPDRSLLRKWHKEYLKEIEIGVIWDEFRKLDKYTPKQKQAAIDHYLEYGRNLSRTVRMLGYPSRETLRHWRDEMVPGTRKSRKDGIQYTQKQKEDAVKVGLTALSNCEFNCSK